MKHNSVLFGMSLHEVPEDLDTVNVAGAERVVVAVVCVALDNLLAGVTAAPQLTHPAVRAIHVGGVLPRLRVTVHVLSDPGDVVHLDVVIPPVIGDHCVVRAGAQVGWQLRGEGDSVVIEAVEIDYADWGVGHWVEPPENNKGT